MSKTWWWILGIGAAAFVVWKFWPHGSEGGDIRQTAQKPASGPFDLGNWASKLKMPNFP